MLVAPNAAQPRLGGMSTSRFTVAHTHDGQSPRGVSTLGALVRAKDPGFCQQRRWEKEADARKRSG